MKVKLVILLGLILLMAATSVFSENNDSGGPSLQVKRTYDNYSRPAREELYNLKGEVAVYKTFYYNEYNGQQLDFTTIFNAKTDKEIAKEFYITMINSYLRGQAPKILQYVILDKQGDPLNADVTDFLPNESVAPDMTASFVNSFDGSYIKETIITISPCKNVNDITVFLRGEQKQQATYVWW